MVQQTMRIGEELGCGSNGWGYPAEIPVDLGGGQGYRLCCAGLHRLQGAEQGILWSAMDWRVGRL